MFLYGIAYILFIYAELPNLCMKYMTAKDAGEKWSLSERRVQILCERGRIEGVHRFGKAWAIPKSAHEPMDARKVPNTEDDSNV